MRRASSKKQMDAIRFGSFIAERRKGLGMTQKELAEKLSVTDKAISRWENGHGFPDIETLEPLAHALEVSLTELLHGEAEEQKTEAAIENALEITIKNRRLERKRNMIVFACSVVLWLAAIGFILFLLGSSFQMAS